MFNKMLGYVKDADFLGEVTGVDFINGMIMLKSDDDSITTKVNDVEILEEAFELNGVIVYDKDVLRSKSGELFLVERHSDGRITTHLLNDSLEISASSEPFIMTSQRLKSYEMLVSLEGNLYELLANIPKKPTFNIKIVKRNLTYYYACNNKDNEEIDLIKVIYMGSNLLEEECYERITMSYDEFNEAMMKNVYKEVSPQELHNYVTGMTYGSKNKYADDRPAEKVCGVGCDCESFCEQESDEPEDICEDCDNFISECDCNPW